MDRIVKQCLKCKQVIGCCEIGDMIHTANNCNGDLKTLNITWEELSLIEDISSDNDFFQAMINLKESDPIEYQLKMSQFKTQLKQQKSIQKQNDTTPRCPNCHSSNIQKIGGLERAGSVAMLGAFSKKINKSFKCKSCGYTW